MLHLLCYIIILTAMDSTYDLTTHTISHHHSIRLRGSRNFVQKAMNAGQSE